MKDGREVACDVTITEVVGIGSPPAFVRVSGTASGCDFVRITLECGGLVLTANAPVSGGVWSANLMNAPCPCGEIVSVNVECVDTDCSAHWEGPLECQGECPNVELSVSVGACNPDGTRDVILTATITPAAGAGAVVAEWDFGDGSGGSAWVAAAGISTTHVESHDYLPPGPYVASLVIVLPVGCAPVPVAIPPLDDCDVVCPEVVDLEVVVSGCAGSGGSASATFSGTVSPPAAGCEFHWDFGDGSSDITTSAPSATHVYTSSGTFAAAVTIICGKCIQTTTVSVIVPPCCPVVTGVSGSVDGCAGGGASATATFVAATNPPSAAGTYTWNFGDGTPAQVTTVPTVTHPFSTPGAKTVQVTFMSSMPGCEPTVASITISVDPCPPPTDDGDGDGDGDGGGGLCGTMAWIVGALSAIAAAITLLTIAWLVCRPGVPIPTYVWVIVGAAWLLVGIAIAVWYIVCSLVPDCPCPTVCDWLQIAVMTALASAAVAAYLSTCCPVFGFVAAGLGAVFIAALIAWVARCHPDICTVLATLLVAVSSAAVPVIAYIILTPLADCASTFVDLVAVTIGALLALITAAKCTE